MVNYPTSLDDDDSLKLVADNVHYVMAEDHNLLKNAIIELETKVGIDSSAVETTHEYKLNNLYDTIGLKDLTAAEVNQLENIGESVTISSGQWGVLGGLAGTLTAAELNHCDGVSSAIQDQLDGKSPIAGSGSIVTVGTIGTGTWDADKIDEAHGGTDQTTYAKGDLLWASANGVLAKLSVGGPSDVLTVGASDALIWQTPGAPGSHSLDSASHDDVNTIPTELKGMLLWYTGSLWDALTQPGTVGHILRCSNVDGTIIWGEIVYGVVSPIVNTSGGGSASKLIESDHIHNASDGSSKVTYGNLLSIPSTFTPIQHDFYSDTYHSGIQCIQTIALDEMAESLPTCTLASASGVDASMTNWYLGENLTRIRTNCTFAPPDNFTGMKIQILALSGFGPGGARRLYFKYALDGGAPVQLGSGVSVPTTLQMITSSTLTVHDKNRIRIFIEWDDDIVEDYVRVYSVKVIWYK